jgi:hypothetical protein
MAARALRGKRGLSLSGISRRSARGARAARPGHRRSCNARGRATTRGGRATARAARRSWGAGRAWGASSRRARKIVTAASRQRYKGKGSNRAGNKEFVLDRESHHSRELARPKLRARAARPRSRKKSARIDALHRFTVDAFLSPRPKCFSRNGTPATTHEQMRGARFHPRSCRPAGTGQLTSSSSAATP